MSKKKYLLTAADLCEYGMAVTNKLGLSVIETSEFIDKFLDEHEYRERTTLYEYRNHAWHCTSCGDVEPVGGAEYCPTCGAHIVGNRGGVL